MRTIMIEEMDWVWVKWVWEVVLEKEISEKEWELIWILPVSQVAVYLRSEATWGGDRSWNWLRGGCRILLYGDKRETGVVMEEISKKYQLTHLSQRPLLLPLYHNTRSLALRLVTVLPMLLQAVVSIHPLYLPVGG